MRIALVSDAIAPYHKGGKETRLQAIANNLAKRGHQVDVYTMHWWDSSSKTIKIEGVDYHALTKKIPLYNKSGSRSIWEGLVFGFSTLKLIGKDFDVMDVDHMPQFAILGSAPVCWLKRKPMVATVHEVWGKQYWKTYLGKKGIFGYAVEWISVRLPKMLLVPSKMTQERVRKVLGTKTNAKLIPNGFNKKVIDSVKPSKKKIDLVMVGRLIAHKRADLAIKAVALLAKEKKKVTLVIHGDGPDRNKLEQLTKSLGVDNQITFAGSTPLVNGYADMKSAKALLLPSSREGFGITVIESLACGTKVITTDDADNAAKELIKNSSAGIVCEPTVESLADAITKILSQKNNSTTRNTTKRNSTQYEWDNVTTELENIYEEVIA